MSAPGRRDAVRRLGCEAERGVERGGALAEELAAAIQVQAVVGVAAIEGAATRRHQPRVAQLAQVVRDEVLLLTDERGELADSTIAARQRREERPAMAITDQPQELGCLVVLHAGPDYISLD